MGGADRVMAKERFARARRRAVREEWVARLLGRRARLFPYYPMARTLQPQAQPSAARLTSIPLDQIVGSVGHSDDFTLRFWPRASVWPERWVLVDVAMSQPEGWPPIEVFQIGDRYFVADGHHRVSVARANGMHDIEAYVTEMSLPQDVQAGGPAEPELISIAEGFRRTVRHWLCRQQDAVTGTRIAARAKRWMGALRCASRRTGPD
jgi:hypothetical protein